MSGLGPADGKEGGAFLVPLYFSHPSPQMNGKQDHVINEQTLIIQRM